MIALSLPLVFTLAACRTAATTPSPAHHASTVSPAAGPSTLPAADPYLRLAQRLAGLGVQVWFEADLVKAWLAGPGPFDAAVARLGALARATHVAGFKIADELGYHDGISSSRQAIAFLRAADTALHAAAPGTEVLIDMVVPELGCLPWLGPRQVSCAQQVRAVSPAAAESAVTSYLRAGLVDRLDLSTGLLSSTNYARWGLTVDAAQRAAWAHVDALGWRRSTRLQARKALAAPGGYAGDAASDLATYVDIPVAAGATAVDVWTWRQQYDGDTVSLLPPGLHANDLWTGLQRRRGDGVHLFTHMTPSQMPTAPTAFDHECEAAAAVFDAVFVASGTG